MRANNLAWTVIAASGALLGCSATTAVSKNADNNAAANAAATVKQDSPPIAPAPSMVTPARPTLTNGYLDDSALPNSAELSPPPPASGSAEMAFDREVNRAALALQGTPRWEMAKRDSVVSFPELAQTFSCALNVPVDESKTPKLIALLKRAWVDAAKVTRSAKQLYNRQRPFMANGKPTCTPDQEAGLRRDGSYPSGHAAIGWSLGLVLSEVSPGQADALVARGRAFAQSRVVCNVHWQSDVREGQMMGSAVVARLHADPAFRHDVEAARIEIEALRLQAQPATANCETEVQALKN